MIEARPSRSAVGESEQFSQRDAVSVSARLGRLQFHHSGKFRVLQLSDVQDGPKVSADTISLIAAACDASRPDLVVFTGDQ
ncbi:MAG: serine/threonine protein phosphatase, partial [Bifidobacterium crudilactis]|nr:serine/threonine protein phosphatase [Bifidobacterium crudilactis]